MNADEIRARTDQLRVKLGFSLVIGGLLFTAGLIVALLIKNVSTTDTVAVAGAFTSVFGTVVGAFFGVQVASADKDKIQADKEKERADRQNSDQKLQVALAETPPDQTKAIFDKWQTLGLVS